MYFDPAPWVEITDDVSSRRHRKKAIGLTRSIAGSSVASRLVSLSSCAGRSGRIWTCRSMALRCRRFRTNSSGGRYEVSMSAITMRAEWKLTRWAE
jgi:hypothetical protein